MDRKKLEINKISAALLLAGIIAMLSGLITNIFYRTEDNSKIKRGYQIAIEENIKKDNIQEEILDIATLMQTATVEKGQKVIKKCIACHSFDKGGAHKVGPNLWNLLGSKVASKTGYTYSASLSAKNVDWNYEEIFAFLAAPKKYAPGTKMSFIGLKKPKDIANLVQYLRDKSDSPYPLP